MTVPGPPRQRFIPMSALLFSASVVVFLTGRVSEQITSLVYSKSR